MILAVTIQTRRGQAAAKESVLRSWLLKRGRRTASAPDLVAAAVLAEYMWLYDDHPVGSPERLRQVMHSAKIRLWSVGKFGLGLWELGELLWRPATGSPPDPHRRHERRCPGRGSRVGSPRVPLRKGDGIDPRRRRGATGGGGDPGDAGGDGGGCQGAPGDAWATASPCLVGERRPPGGTLVGLTARQAEVLTLLDQALTDAVIADRLFVSPRHRGEPRVGYSL